jgi:hypothetical protein
MLKNNNNACFYFTLTINNNNNNKECDQVSTKTILWIKGPK